MTIPGVTTVVVAVPVHNEAELLDRCLSALSVAAATAARRGIRCVVRIVLDGCTDGSRLIAEAHQFPTMTISAERVGDARARGIEAAMQELRHIPPQRVWIANTDADSAVPPNWIVAQCELAASGADVFIGTVRPDFADLSPRHQRHWVRTHSSGTPNGHVHGASLGIRASTYTAAGGFEAVEEHEDVELVRRCLLLGANLRASATAEVLTSGRFIGRTPAGYAGYLRAQAEILR
ncbi:glycosyltransferase [Microbacterium sp. P5_E9]